MIDYKVRTVKTICFLALLRDLSEVNTHVQRRAKLP